MRDYGRTGTCLAKPPQISDPRRRKAHPLGPAVAVPQNPREAVLTGCANMYTCGKSQASVIEPRIGLRGTAIVVNLTP